jgi:hypothetical protein
VRLGRASAQGLVHGLVGSGALIGEDLQIVETMTVELSAMPGAFKIDRQSRNTQLVANADGVSVLDAEKFGRWTWHVTPLRRGKHDLLVKVSGEVVDSRGVQGSAVLPDRVFKVQVRVSYRNFASTAFPKIALWVAGGAVTGLVSAATREYWWPIVQPWVVAIVDKFG